MSMNLSKESTNELLYVGFNQDNGCFACGTTDGFVIFNIEPYRETIRRVFQNGGIGIVEMLFRCNLIAIVGGGRYPKYPTNKVMIWDDHQNKCIGELMFKNEVHAVKLRRDRVVVVLNTKVYVYRFSDLKLIDQISTIANPRGLVSLCPETTNNVLAVPGLARGSIRVELYNISKATIIKAHDADLAQFALNSDGSRVASASEKGTLIRLWDCHTGDPLREFRRGTDRAEIYCITFNNATTFLACSSDKGTIHIFSLSDRTPTDESNLGAGGAAMGSNVHRSADPSIGAVSNVSNDEYRSSDNTTVGMGNSHSPSTGNKGFGLKFLRGVIPPGMIPKYVNSEWSFAQIRGLDCRSICAFDKDIMKIIVLTAEGTFLLCNFEEGGECHREAMATFIRFGDEVDRTGVSMGMGQPISAKYDHGHSQSQGTEQK